MGETSIIGRKDKVGIQIVEITFTSKKKKACFCRKYKSCFLEIIQNFGLTAHCKQPSTCINNISLGGVLPGGKEFQVQHPPLHEM